MCLLATPKSQKLLLSLIMLSFLLIRSRLFIRFFILPFSRCVGALNSDGAHACKMPGATRENARGTTKEGRFATETCEYKGEVR